MVPIKIFHRELAFDFNKELIDEPVFELPLSVHPELLPHGPLEGIPFTLLALDNSPDTMTRLASEVFNLMLEGKAQFVVEDLCHIPREKGYWCRIGEEGMMTP